MALKQPQFLIFCNSVGLNQIENGFLMKTYIQFKILTITFINQKLNEINSYTYV